MGLLDGKKVLITGLIVKSCLPLLLDNIDLAEPAVGGD